MVGSCSGTPVGKRINLRYNWALKWRGGTPPPPCRPRDSTGETHMEKIMVVEDDLALSAGLCFELDSSGYLTVAAYNCQKARQLLAGDHFDLALLDVNLPDGNGFDLEMAYTKTSTSPLAIAREQASQLLSNHSMV